MLQLLTPEKAKTAREGRELDDLQRADAIKNITKELLAAKASAEKQFEETMETQRSRWEHENAAWLVKRGELRREVEDLESRRRDALIPIVITEKDLHNKVEGLVAIRQAQMDERDESFEERDRALMKRLDEVAEREQQQKAFERALALEQSGIKAQKEQTIKESQALARQMSMFQAESVAKTAELSRLQAELEGKNTRQSEYEKELILREEEVKAGRRYIKDREAMLERAFAELTRKNK